MQEAAMIEKMGDDLKGLKIIRTKNALRFIPQIGIVSQQLLGIILIHDHLLLGLGIFEKDGKVPNAGIQFDSGMYAQQIGLMKTEIAPANIGPALLHPACQHQQDENGHIQQDYMFDYGGESEHKV
jgi:hypothetical protein